MAAVNCPMCGKPNPPELEVCQFCGARIKPLLASTPDDSRPIRPGEHPTKGVTSDLEKVNSAKSGSIHPGELPTKKNTAELEKALPSWLRSLRGKKNSLENESQENSSSDESLPVEPAATPAPDSDSSGALPDWLSGFDKAASEEDEEVPDWLAGLRSDKPAETSVDSPSELESTPELGNPDWMARLGGEPPAATFESSASEQPEPGVPPKPASEAESPDWLKSLQSGESGSQEPLATSTGEENLPDWFSGLPDISAESQPAFSGAPEPAPAEDLPDWLNQLQEKTPGPEASTPVGGGEAIPDWLSGFGSEPETPESAPSAPVAGGESIPDWLSGLGTVAETPASTPAEEVPDWLSNLEGKPASESETPAALQYSESETSSASSGETPSWLSQLQANFNTPEDVGKRKDDFEVASEISPQAKDSMPIPEWLAGIEPTAPPSGGTPALIVEDMGNPPGETGETAFSMEAPDWLNKLKPEQGAEKTSGNEEEQTAGDLKTAELPSWVQAMRPLESVADEAKSALQHEEQLIEKSGPLAGLVGVLPSGPGLGLLRKPPAYSGKLQITEGQQRHIASFDRLVAGETEPRQTKAVRLTSNRLWRWAITLMLGLAVGLPLLRNSHVTPPTSLLPSDQGATSTLIEAIPANAPVLIAFDYDPALSGELEAAAAPLVDRLQSKGSRLTLVSTSLTGPALAERFLQTTLLVNSHQYLSGEQYVNLGYLAGGPAGISYFASAPADAMPYTVDGGPAWSTPPLQGINHLSDFSAVIILTDNADTGRNWIEQSGQYLGKTPLLMVISAQAEPMVQPYFDSGQLKGLVSGMYDAKTYEQGYNRPGLAYHYWDSFSIGMLVAELLIGIGAAWSAYLAWRLRRKDNGEKA